MGFDDARRVEHARQFGLTPDKLVLAETLARDVIAPRRMELGGAFYRALHEQPSYERIVAEPNLGSRVLQHQRDYVATFGRDFLSEAYFEKRLEIGATHVRLGVPLADYVAVVTALEQALSMATEELLGHAPHTFELIGFIIAVGGLDVSLATECYHRLTLDEVEQHLRKAQSDHEALRSVVRRDSLTGISSRDHVLANLATAVFDASRLGTPLSVAMVDIDHFKRVNDTHGHLVGDLVLRGIAQRMRDALRDDDLVGRYGGEEFLLLLRGAPLTTAAAVADRLRQRIATTPIDAEGQRVHVSTSMGIAQLRAGEDATSLLARADAALYRAKALGRDRVALST